MLEISFEHTRNSCNSLCCLFKCPYVVPFIVLSPLLHFFQGSFSFFVFIISASSSPHFSTCLLHSRPNYVPFSFLSFILKSAVTIFVHMPFSSSFPCASSFSSLSSPSIFFSFSSFPRPPSYLTCFIPVFFTVPSTISPFSSSSVPPSLLSSLSSPLPLCHISYSSKSRPRLSIHNRTRSFLIHILTLPFFAVLVRSNLVLHLVTILFSPASPPSYPQSFRPSFAPAPSLSSYFSFPALSSSSYRP